MIDQGSNSIISSPPPPKYKLLLQNMLKINSSLLINDLCYSWRCTFLQMHKYIAVIDLLIFHMGYPVGFKSELQHLLKCAICEHVNDSSPCSFQTGTLYVLSGYIQLTDSLKHFSIPLSTNHINTYQLATCSFIHSIMASSLMQCLMWEPCKSNQSPPKVFKKMAPTSLTNHWKSLNIWHGRVPKSKITCAKACFVKERNLPNFHTKSYSRY
jgi:hypothetical protein